MSGTWYICQSLENVACRENKQKQSFFSMRRDYNQYNNHLKRDS